MTIRALRLIPALRLPRLRYPLLAPIVTTPTKPARPHESGENKGAACVIGYELYGHVIVNIKSDPAAQ